MVLLPAPEDLECFTFLPAPSPRLMWTRRQAHETAIHRADAEVASGPITAYPPDFAADGIDELLTGFLARRGRGPRTDVAYTMRVDPDDVDAVWSLSVAPDSYVVAREHRPADVALSAPASDLYLLLRNRLDPSDVAVEGDDSLLGRWREGARVRWGEPTRLAQPWRSRRATPRPGTGRSRRSPRASSARKDPVTARTPAQRSGSDGQGLSVRLTMGRAVISVSRSRTRSARILPTRLDAATPPPV